MSFNYLYAGGDTTGRIYRYRLSDLLKTDQSDIYGEEIHSIITSNDFIYAAGRITHKVYKYAKNSLDKIAESSSYGTNIAAMVADDDYIYCGGWSSTGRVWKLNKSDLSFVAQSNDFGKAIYAIAQDDDYIYCGSSNYTSGYVLKLQKSDLSQVATSDDYGADVYGIAADDTDYVYFGGHATATDKVWKLLKSDMTKDSESGDCEGGIYSLTEDTTHLYIGTGLSASASRIKKILKSDMSTATENKGFSAYFDSIICNGSVYAGDSSGIVRAFNKSDLSETITSTHEYGGAIYAMALSEEVAVPILDIATPKKLYTTKEINGAWTADLEITHESIDCEQYIDIDGEQYIVKIPTDYKDRNGAFTQIKAYHIGMAELGDTTIDRFNRKDTVENFLDLILDGSTWTAGTCDISETIYLHTDKRVSRLEALNRLAEVCGGELYFNSTDRTVDLKREVGTFTGLQIRYDKNSDYIAREMDSTNLVTRIYPYGSDNLAINQTTISYCEEPTDWTMSGAGTATASNAKMFGSQATSLAFAALNETAINDLGVSGVIDLTDHDTVKFMVYSATDIPAGLTFGIGESAYTENTVNTGALSAGCWKEFTLDLSAVADGDKNAIRYLGFKNLTDGAATVIIDGIRGFYGNQYIDSPNISKYKVNKEYVYRHSAKPEKETFTKRIYPSDDTYGAQDYPNSTLGTRTYIKVRDRSGAADDYQSFIKFDISELPTGATITDAKVNLYFYRAENVGKDTSIKLVTADWNEDTLTWNNKPTIGASLTTLQTEVADGYGWKQGSITSTVSDWYDGTTSNYGLALVASAADASQQTVHFWSKEASEYRPYLEVTYTMLTDPNDVIIAGATSYLYDHHEPAVRYSVNLADLSEVIKDTWHEETIGLGDTVRVYDKDLDLNVNVRVQKITKNLLDPRDVQIDLVNRAYTIADLEAKRERQLSYAMPCQDNPNIIDAQSIQVGYLGSDVQV